jgi:hypothetical protein
VISRWLPAFFAVGMAVEVIRAGSDGHRFYRALAFAATWALLGIWHEVAEMRHERKQGK